MTLAPAASPGRRLERRGQVPWAGFAATPPGHLLPLLVLATAVAAFYTPFLWSGTAQWDAIEVHYSGQRYVADAMRAGRLPFWTPYVFSGFPLLADLQVGAWYPLNWPFMLLGITPDSMNAELAVHALIASAGAYALGIRLGFTRGGAIATAMFYALSGYVAGHSQHVGMVQTAAWLPWLVLVLGILAEGVTTRRLALASLLGAAIALPGAFQTALYAVTFAGLAAVLDAFGRRSIRHVARVIVGLSGLTLGGGALAAIMILPGLELVRQSVRTELDAGQVGLGYFQLEDVLTLVQPNHYGVLLDSAYTGPGDVTQHYLYAGILLGPLALIGLTNARVVRTALLLGLPFIWYALGPGTGLFDLLAQAPGFRSVELPMHGWFLPALGLAMLGGAGVTALRRWLGVVPLGVLFAVLLADLLTFNVVQNRLTYARGTSDSLYLAPMRAVQAQLDATSRRIYGPPLAAMVYRNHGLQSRVETTYGYNPLELIRYAAYVDAAQDNPRLVAGLAATHWLDGTGLVEPLPETLPLAYFARAVTWLPDDASARAALAELDPRVETLAVGLPLEFAVDPAARIDEVGRGEDWLVLRYRSATPNVVRVALPIYPGWRATLGTTELRTFAVDHAFIGVAVPPGEGEVRLAYTPRYFWLGAGISAAALVLVVSMLLGGGSRLTSRLGLTR